jgi:hypothetical protein
MKHKLFLLTWLAMLCFFSLVVGVLRGGNGQSGTQVGSDRFVTRKRPSRGLVMLPLLRPQCPTTGRFYNFGNSDLKTGNT